MFMKVLIQSLAMAVAIFLASASAEEAKLPPDIHLSKMVTMETMKAILAAREPKDPADIWNVDAFHDDVRIRRSRKDDVFYPPGGSTEFWHKDSKTGQWKRRPTA
jgi:hypothetical protein